MIDSTQALTPAADAAKPTDAAAPTSSRAVSNPSNTRVYVDQDASGGFIYRLVDVTTGRVLVELPRERADELTDIAGYAAGTLVPTSG